MTHCKISDNDTFSDVNCITSGIEMVATKKSLTFFGHGLSWKMKTIWQS